MELGGLVLWQLLGPAVHPLRLGVGPSGDRCTVVGLGRGKHGDDELPPLGRAV